MKITVAASAALILLASTLLPGPARATEGAACNEIRTRLAYQSQEFIRVQNSSHVDVTTAEALQDKAVTGANGKTDPLGEIVQRILFLRSELTANNCK